MSKAILAAVAAVVSAESDVPSMLSGRPWVDAEESIKDIGMATQRVEAGLSGLTADRDVLDNNLLGWVVQTGADGKFLRFAADHPKTPNKLVPIEYPAFMKVREIYAGAAFDAGAATLDAAGKVWERAIGRLIGLDFVRPLSKSEDAVRIAAKRAKEAAKYADKSDAELGETYRKLVAVGDVKSSVEATAVAKQIAERAKPEMAKLQADIKLLHETLKKCAADWAKAGTAEAAEMLTAGIMAMSKAVKR